MSTGSCSPNICTRWYARAFSIHYKAGSDNENAAELLSTTKKTKIKQMKNTEAIKSANQAQSFSSILEAYRAVNDVKTEEQNVEEPIMEVREENPGEGLSDVLSQASRVLIDDSPVYLDLDSQVEKQNK
ncbi:hypothetical protein JTE90_028986 [Oedothorax gibbosus]|uniref:Uncharacterized protein n=1 Tax=Oedothorax gibbosus TaxID=931172 RepID=A0AAV6VKD5_9ARAC|nr:hypothetical protein JTE90_028986 [Oedothorax gibbosus]